MALLDLMCENDSVGSLQDITLLGDADGCEQVVSCGNNAPDLALVELFDDCLGVLFQLVVHDHDPEESERLLCFDLLSVKMDHSVQAVGKAEVNCFGSVS